MLHLYEIKSFGRNANTLPVMANTLSEALQKAGLVSASGLAYIRKPVSSLLQTQAC